MGKKSLISEPKVLLTGTEGSGKTLFAVEQASLLAAEGGGDIWQLNIRGADPAHLPQLPFPLSEMAKGADGKPVVDPETGDELPRWAVDLAEGSVVIVDEAHKVFPQRGPGRPPKWMEMLAEGRQHGIRFILMTQNPDSLDSFIRGKISRHFHLERKGGLQRATVLEFDHLVLYPQTQMQERKRAIVHFWKYPKQFYGWYTSAKSHHFRVRIPLKIWAALLFVPVAAFIAWRVFHGVGPAFHGLTGVGHARQSISGAGDDGSRGGGAAGRERVSYDDLDGYRREFEGLNPSIPWSARAYRSRAVVAQPVVYCLASGRGAVAGGSVKAASCSCLSEQGTAVDMTVEMCQAVASRGGVYNPYKPPASAFREDRDFAGGSDAGVSAPPFAAGVPPPAAAVGEGRATGFGAMPGYGGIGVGANAAPASASVLQ